MIDNIENKIENHQLQECSLSNKFFSESDLGLLQNPRWKVCDNS